MPTSQVPTKEQQILAGEALLHIQGPSAWVCNAIQGYPLHSGDSMFDGGVNPYPNGGSSDPAPDPQPAPKPKPAPKPNPDGTYTVVSGDTLYKIAEAQLGNGNQWHKLYALNKDVIGDNPDVIEIGMVLNLHDNGHHSTPAPNPAPETESATYTVVSGDTLYGIAIAHGIGDGGLDTWKPLYEANKDVVGEDPDLIFPGQVLTLPGATSAPVTPPPAEKPADPAPSTHTDPPKTTPKDSGWSAPIDAPITQVFHNPGNYGTGWHTGVDFSAPLGTHVMAVAHATVVHVGYGGAGGAYGNHIILKLDDGNYVLYGHLSSTRVSQGQVVEGGDWIGNVGTTGNSTGPHLHFELRNSAFQYNASVFSDPVAYLAEHGVRL
jgi:murein DD-endopeptidase MepM/ murein hydrolase activator NlpD